MCSCEASRAVSRRVTATAASPQQHLFDLTLRGRRFQGPEMRQAQPRCRRLVAARGVSHLAIRASAHRSRHGVLLELQSCYARHQRVDNLLVLSIGVRSGAAGHKERLERRH